MILLAIPEFPRPVGTSDTAINMNINAVQRKGKGENSNRDGN